MAAAAGILPSSSTVLNPGRTQLTSTPSSFRYPSTWAISDPALLAMVFTPTRLTVRGLFSAGEQKRSISPIPASRVPCMKSPVALPSSSKTATLTPGCSFSISCATDLGSSPIIPGGQAVMTAKSRFPRATCSPIFLFRSAFPPKTMVSSPMSVHTTSGSRKLSEVRYPLV